MKTRPQISIFVRPTRRVRIASNEMTLNGFKWFRSTIRPTWHCVDVINCGVNWLNGLVCENGDFWGGYWGAPLRRASTWIGGRQEEASPKIEMFGSWQELKRPPCGGLANSFAVFDFGAAFVSVFFSMENCRPEEKYFHSVQWEVPSRHEAWPIDYVGLSFGRQCNGLVTLCHPAGWSSSHSAD